MQPSSAPPPVEMWPKPSSFSQARALLGDDRAGDRVHAAGDPLADDHDVGLDPGLGDAPHLAGAHQPGLHLVGDVERAVPLAQPLDRLQVAGLGQREAVGRRDRLDEHAGDVAAAQRLLHRVEVVERHLDELVRPVGEEELGEALVARRHREAGVPVVALEDRDDLAPLARVAGGLDRDVGRLAAARAVDRPAAASAGRWRPAPRRARSARAPGSGGCRCRTAPSPARASAISSGIAVAEVVRAAVEVQVDQPPARHVPEQVALAAVDHEVDAGVLPEPRLVRVPELLRAPEEVLLGLEREEAVVVHAAPGATVP